MCVYMCVYMCVCVCVCVCVCPEYKGSNRVFFVKIWDILGSSIRSFLK